MLDTLPVEIIREIVGHLPSVSSILTLSLVNRRLHEVTSHGNYICLKGFLHTAFPTVRTSSHWRQDACILTTRARAWRKRAIVSRVMTPTYQRSHNARSYFSTAVDSYEEFPTSQWSDRRTVVAWATTGRIVIRIKQGDQVSWIKNSDWDDYDAWDDVADIHLLRPHQRPSGQEQLIVRRENGEISRFVSGSDNVLHLDTILVTKTGTDNLRYHNSTRVTVNNAPKPLILTCGRDVMLVFDAQSESQRPISSTPYPEESGKIFQTRYAKFLTEDRFAFTRQSVRGQEHGQIQIYTLRPDGPCEAVRNLAATQTPHVPGSRPAVYSLAIAPLDPICSLAGRTGEVFLSGCSDGVTRLCDLRDPTPVKSSFVDTVDDNRVTCLLPFGHERFLAGGGEDSCVRCFDLRMPGSNVFSQGSPSLLALSLDESQALTPSQNELGTPQANPSREVNILPCGSRHRGNSGIRLGGRSQERRPIHALSATSPMASTFYAATFNDVVQFDFLSTDDWNLRQQSLGLAGFDIPSVQDGHLLNSACYERPRHRFQRNDPVVLMKQIEMKATITGIENGGWDERWRKAGQESGPRVWRRQSG